MKLVFQRARDAVDVNTLIGNSTGRPFEERSHSETIIFSVEFVELAVLFKLKKKEKKHSRTRLGYQTNRRKKKKINEEEAAGEKKEKKNRFASDRN